MEAEINWKIRGHDFYPPDDQLQAIPRLYATASTPIPDTVVRLHYFHGSSDWWIAELDQESGLAFGYVCLGGDSQMAEWGYVELSELEALYVSGGVFKDQNDAIAGVRNRILIERDLSWVPRTVAEIGLPGRGGRP